LILLPEAPDRIVPFTVIALFDVDATGKVLSFTFNETRDADFNRKLRGIFAQVRFTPAVTREGVPVRATARLEFDIF
jgi:hypothetical protein